MTPGTAIAIYPGGRIEVLPYTPTPPRRLSEAQHERALDYVDQGYQWPHAIRMAQRRP